jgi:hypothetical protein
VNFFSGKAFGVTTNVIGPKAERYVGGAKMTGLVGWVPTTGNQSVGACILTYNGRLRVGFKVDAGIVPDPHRLVLAFDETIDEFLAIVHTPKARSPRRRTTPTTSS